MRKKFIIAASIILSILLLYFVFNYSWIEIRYSNNEGNTKLTLVGENNRLIEETTISKTSYRKLVRKGIYEISAESGLKGTFAVIKVGGWLKTTDLDLILEFQSNRSFVAKNPEECTYESRSVVYSVECGGAVTAIKYYVDPTNTSPPVQKTVQTNINGIIEGEIIESNVTYLLVREFNTNSPHVLYSLENNGTLSRISDFNFLSSNKVYRTQQGSKGSYIFSTDGEDVFVLNSVSSKPERLTSKSIQGETYGLIELQDSLALITSSSGQIDQSRITTHDGKASHSEEFEKSAVAENSTLISMDGSLSVPLEFSPFNIVGCGNARICAVKDGEVYIYKLNDSELTEVYKFSNTSDIFWHKEGLILARTEGLILFDVDSMKGRTIYNYDDVYVYCGVKVYASYIHACIIDSTNDLHVLSLTMDSPATDQVDIKLGHLLESKLIEDFNARGNIVYISPALPEPDYIESLGIFGYDPELLKATHQSILNKARDLGIDSEKYKIINPFML